MNDPRSDAAVSADISNKKMRKMARLHQRLYEFFSTIFSRSAKSDITAAEKAEFMQIITALKELSPDALQAEYNVKSKPTTEISTTESSSSPLMCACRIFLKTGNPFFIEELVKVGADINAPCEAPPIKMAATALNPVAVQTLIDKYGAHVDCLDNLGFTAFQLLITLINCNKINFEAALPTLQALLQYKPSMRVKMKNLLEKGDVYINTTALHVVVRAAHRGLFDLVLPHIKEVDVQDGDGLTAFHQLLYSVKRHGHTGNQQLSLPIIFRQESRDRKGRIRQKDSILQQHDNIPIHINNFVYITIALLQRGASLSIETNEGVSVSSLISEVATPEMLDAILEFYKNNLNDERTIELIELMIDLCRRQNLVFANKIYGVIDKKLIKGNPSDLSQEGKDLLLGYGLQLGDLSLVQRLVAIGADIHYKMEVEHPVTHNFIRTSLPTIATLATRRDVLEYFVSQDPNILVNDQQVLFAAVQSLAYLDLTIQKVQLDNLTYLLANRASPDLDSSDCNGVSKSFPSTPLALACLLGNARVVVMLLMQGADPTHRTANHTLSITCAIQGRHRIMQKNNPDRLSFKGLLVDGWHVTANHLQVIRLLLASKKYQRSDKVKDNPLCLGAYYSIDKEFFFGLLDLYKSSPADLLTAARYAVGIDKLEYFRWIHEFLLSITLPAVAQKSMNEEKSTPGEKAAGESKRGVKSGETLENISEVSENHRMAKQLLVDGLFVAYSMKNKRLVRQFLREYNLDPHTQCPDSQQTIFQWLNNIFPQPQADTTSAQSAESSADAALPKLLSLPAVKIISSRQFLMTLGFTTEDIADMRRCALEASTIAAVPDIFKERKTPDRKVQGSWFENQLKYEGKDSPELKSIERTTNCCLWIPRNRLLASGCPEPLLQEFYKLTPSIGTKNLKKLKGMDHQQIIRIGGKEYLLDLMYELKVASSPDRLVIYSCDVPDENNAKLFVALHYVKDGFHGGAGEKQLLSSNALIDLTSDISTPPAAARPVAI